MARDDAAVNGTRIADAEIARLAEAWRRAEYAVVLDDRRWPLRIGSTAEAIEQRLMAARYLLITAWNPPPGVDTPERNRAADARLRQRLFAGGFRMFPAEASDGQGGWREPGWLALDVPAATADGLAQAFRQGGVLYWQRGGPVRLRLGWRRPPDVPADAHTDWRD